MTDLNLSRQTRAAQQLIALAIELGWIAKPMVGGSVKITSPDAEHSQMHIFPAGASLNARKEEQLRRKIWRYGDPMRRLELEAVAAAPGVTRGITIPVIADQVVREVAEDEGYGAVPTLEAPTATVVSEHPWMARRGSSAHEGRHYESAAVIERKWSDGSTDYRCSWPGCDFSAPAPISVSRHYGRSKDHMPRDPGDVVRGPAYEWTPRSQSKADRLAREIAKAWSLVPMDVAADKDAFIQKMAEQIIREREQRHEVHDGDTETGGGEPLTPEQVIERIRRLVDSGAYMARVEEAEQLRSELRDVQAQLQRSEANALAVVEAATKGAEELEKTKLQLAEAEAEWAALREIIDSRRAVAR